MQFHSFPDQNTAMHFRDEWKYLEIKLGCKFWVMLMEDIGVDLSLNLTLNHQCHWYMAFSDQLTNLVSPGVRLHVTVKSGMHD